MTLEDLKSSGLMWFEATIYPQLQWYEQVGVCLCLPAVVDKYMTTCRKVLETAGLINADNTINHKELKERLQSLFKQGDSFPIRIAEHEFTLKKAHIEEIIDGALI